MSLPMKLGSKDTPQTASPKVAQLQGLLNVFLHIALVQDGSFGKKTESAVKQFQTTAGLRVDGVVNRKTWNELSSEANPPTSPPSVPTTPPVVVVTPPPVVVPVPPTTSTDRIGAKTFGAYVEDASGQATLWDIKPLTDMEAKLGKQLDIVSGFCQAGDISDLVTNMKKVAPRKVMLSYDVQYSAADVLAGKYDSQFKADATAIKSLGSEVMLRLWAEMNGDWATWSVAGSASKVKSTADWISAWKHIVTIFRSVTHLAKFVWCVNNTDEGSVKMEQYFPGVDWVDYTGADGYSWKGNYQTFYQIFQDCYRRITTIAPSVPFVVGECGIGESAQKPGWITNMLNDVSFSKIVAVAMFSVNKEENWSLDSSTTAVAAYRDGLV